MGNQQKIIFYAVCLPISGRLAVVLFLDYELLEREPGVLENAHYVERHWHHAALPPRVAHEDGAEPALLEHAEAFGSDRPHGLEKVADLQAREVGLPRVPQQNIARDIRRPVKSKVKPFNCSVTRRNAPCRDKAGFLYKFYAFVFFNRHSYRFLYCDAFPRLSLSFLTIPAMSQELNYVSFPQAL